MSRSSGAFHASRSVDSYVQLTWTLARMLADEGLGIIAHREDVLYFAMLDPGEQERTMTTLERYLDVCRRVRESGCSLRDDAQMLWRMLRSLGLRPPADLLAHLEKGDLVEIYDEANLQLFRNYSFYAICSYSIDETLCRPWFELYRRDGLATEALHKVIARAMRATGQMILSAMPPHILQEVGGARRNRMLNQQRIVAPLWGSQGQPRATLVVTQILSCESTIASP